MGTSSFILPAVYSCTQDTDNVQTSAETVVFIHTASAFTFCKIRLSETLEDNFWKAYNTPKLSHEKADFTWCSKIR